MKSSGGDGVEVELRGGNGRGQPVSCFGLCLAPPLDMGAREILEEINDPAAVNTSACTEGGADRAAE